MALKVTLARSAVTSGSALKVQTALKSALAKQLAQEARTLGHAPGTAAVHAMTGISGKQGKVIR